MFADDHSIVSLIHYGAEYHLDRWMSFSAEIVVIMLFDGLGMEVLRAAICLKTAFKEPRAGELSSVFPPTTTAATTSIESGLTPAEPDISAGICISLNWAISFRSSPTPGYAGAGCKVPCGETVSVVPERSMRKNRETGNAKA